MITVCHSAAPATNATSNKMIGSGQITSLNNNRTHENIFKKRPKLVLIDYDLYCDRQIQLKYPQNSEKKQCEN